MFICQQSSFEAVRIICQNILRFWKVNDIDCATTNDVDWWWYYKCRISFLRSQLMDEKGSAVLRGLR